MEDVAFRFLAANQQPDFRSIARFRRRHLAAIEELFVQTVRVCATAGLVKLGGSRSMGPSCGPMPAATRR